MTAEQVLKQIPSALKNIGVTERIPELTSYIFNVVVAVLQDKELQKKLQANSRALIDELTKL